MKILHVISPLTKGGAERVAVDLANACSRSGDEVAILASNPADSQLLQADVDLGVDLRFVGKADKSRWSTYLAAPRWLWVNREFVRSRDIVHGHLSFGSVFGFFVVLLRSLGRRRRPKVLETYHAVGMAMAPAKRQLHMLLAAWHDGLVAMAEDPVIAAFRRSHPALPYALIRNGIALERGRPSPAASADYRKSLGIADGIPVVGTIGRIVPDRSPDRVAQIFGFIARERQDVHFVMGGEGPLVQRVRTISCDWGYAGRLSLPGLVLDPALPLSIFDLFVTLNVGSITGVAALEAAAAGVPLVALQLDDTYVPRVDDWIFSSADPAAVASEAARLLASPTELRALAKRQRDFVHRHHGIDAMAAAYRTFYRALLA